jgi:hypothetical protein
MELGRVRAMGRGRGVTAGVDAVVHVRVSGMAGIRVAVASGVGVPGEHGQQEVARAEDGETEIGEGEQKTASSLVSRSKNEVSLGEVGTVQ